MTFRRYTVEELHHLRQSPLVHKPDALPSIDQWMEGGKQAEQAAAQRRKTQPGRVEDTAQENALSRLPVNLRRGISRGQSEDIVLGPPKMGFTSNNRIQNRTESTEKRTSATFGDEVSSKDRGEFQDGFFKPRENPREKNTAPGGRRIRETGEDGWTSVRNRRSSQTEEGDRWDRLGDRERRPARDTSEPLEAPLRRNGVGRGKFDSPWTRNESAEPDTGKPEGRASNWRERDRDRERTRDWTRGTKFEAHTEEDPEWMVDEPADDKKQKHTQEDFQRWKEQMRANTGPTKDKDEPVDAPASASLPAAPQREELMTTKSANALPTLGYMFGTWDDKKAEAKTDAPSQKAAKASRFQTWFKKEETPPADAAPPRPVSRNNDNGSAEDKAGFERILLMLGGTSTPNPNEQPVLRPPPQPARVQNPEQERYQQERHQESQQPDRVPERQRDSAGFIDDLLARQHAAQERGTRNVAQPRTVQRFPPELGHHVVQHGDVDFGRFANERPDLMMGRDGYPQMPVDMNGQASQAQNRGRELLLDLIQNNRHIEGPQRAIDLVDHPFFAGPAKGMPPPQQTQMANQHNAPSAPPGLDAHRRQVAEQEMAAARRAQMPPGFFDHDGPLPEQAMVPPGLVRRNTSETANGGPQGARPAAQASNLGIPSLPMNDMMWMRNAQMEGRLGHAGPPPGLMSPPGSMPQGPPPSSAGGLNGLSGGSINPMRGVGGPQGLPMGPPGFPPQGLPMNMRGMPPMPPPGAFFPGGPMPGMPPMGGPGGGPPGFFGRGFPPFEEQMRGGGRGF